ncbi:recombination regulator RecX, partial [Streptomyces sp. NPDC002130]
MTRRTDWAEYEYAASGAPRGRGTGGETGSAVEEADGFGDTPFEGDPECDLLYGDGDDTGPHGGGSPRGGSRDGGPRGRRGRRRGFGEAAADTEDGGALSSSRAEQEAPPGDPVERARAICLRLLTGTPR